MFSLQDSIPKELNADLPRFGHTAVLNNGTMLIHGGFHGKGETKRQQGSV